MRRPVSGPQLAAGRTPFDHSGFLLAGAACREWPLRGRHFVTVTDRSWPILLKNSFPSVGRNSCGIRRPENARTRGNSIPRRKRSTVPSPGWRVGCPRRSSNWTSFSSHWARAWDGHEVVDLAVGRLALHYVQENPDDVVAEYIRAQPPTLVYGNDCDYLARKPPLGLRQDFVADCLMLS